MAPVLNVQDFGSRFCPGLESGWSAEIFGDDLNAVVCPEQRLNNEIYRLPSALTAVWRVGGGQFGKKAVLQSRNVIYLRHRQAELQPPLIKRGHKSAIDKR